MLTTGQDVRPNERCWRSQWITTKMDTTTGTSNTFYTFGRRVL
jgi:hypothetical protein